MLGVVVYAGRDTRIQRNARRSAPSKVGAYDRFLNVQVIALIVLQVALCVALAVAAFEWRRDHKGAYYFMWEKHSTGKSGNNAQNGLAFVVISFLTFWCVVRMEWAPRACVGSCGT